MLTDSARIAFEGRRQYREWGGRCSWICQRVELNAFSAPQLVDYIERRLQETGVRGKIVPPDTHLKETTRHLYRTEVATRVQRAIETLLPIDALTDRLQDQFSANAPLDAARAWIEQAFTADKAQWGRDALRREVNRLLWDQMDAIAAAVRLALIEAIQDGALTNSEDVQG